MRSAAGNRRRDRWPSVLGGVVLLTVGGVLMYAGFTEFYSHPWDLVAGVIGGKSTTAKGAPAPPAHGGASGR